MEARPLSISWSHRPMEPSPALGVVAPGDHEGKPVALAGPRVLALDEGPSRIIGVGRRDRGDRRDRGVGGGLAHHGEVRDRVGPQHDRRPGEEGDVQRGSEGLEVEHAHRSWKYPGTRWCGTSRYPLASGNPPKRPWLHRTSTCPATSESS